MICKKQRVGLFSGSKMLIKKKIQIWSFSRRVPNVDHIIKGYQDSFTSFYLSACDVSRYLSFDLFEIFKKNRTLLCHHGHGHEQ